VSLIKYLASFVINNTKDVDGIYLDFFCRLLHDCARCTRAHKEDGGNRKFICAQLPEKCDADSEALKAGYKTIAEIGKERIRRVIKNIQEETRRQT